MTWMEPEIQLLQRRAENPNEKYIGSCSGLQKLQSFCQRLRDFCKDPESCSMLQTCWRDFEEGVFTGTYEKASSWAECRERASGHDKQWLRHPLLGSYFQICSVPFKKLETCQTWCVARISPSRAVGREDTWWWFSIVVAGSHQLELE